MNDLVVALAALPPEGLELLLHLSPQVMAALAAGDGEEPPALLTPLTGVLRLRRLGPRLEVRGDFQVEAALACDRCLAPASASVAGEIAECLILAEGEAADADEALAVIDGRVDLSGLLAESFWLAWPYRFICRPDCAGLCLACGADLNRGPCGCPG
ncbi:MAG: DUF177 domain-containing protein [Deltaproteobacteria bacterium]|nr:DUF177 domain-containing protein [Deltaproteobacteria bacterium]